MARAIAEAPIGVPLFMMSGRAGVPEGFAAWPGLLGGALAGPVPASLLTAGGTAVGGAAGGVVGGDGGLGSVTDPDAVARTLSPAVLIARTAQVSGAPVWAITMTIGDVGPEVDVLTPCASFQHSAR